MKSNFVNMVLVLFVITLVASAGVGYIYTLTEGTIAEANARKQADAIKSVIPVEFDTTEEVRVPTDIDSVDLFYAMRGGELVGTAVKSFSKSGFGGEISLMIGFSPEGDITGYSVLEANETPGLGSKMSTWFTAEGKGDVIGMNPEKKALSVTKDGGDVDAITAATISSRAFCEAVNRAANAINGVTDAVSGATGSASSTAGSDSEASPELSSEEAGSTGGSAATDANSGTTTDANSGATFEAEASEASDASEDAFSGATLSLNSVTTARNRTNYSESENLRES